MRARDVDESLGARHLRGADDEAHREGGTGAVRAIEELAVAIGLSARLSLAPPRPRCG